VKISKTVLDSVEGHTRECYPDECCGILLAHGSEFTVTGAIRAENEEKLSPGQRYALGRRAHLRAVELEASGKYRIAGYYHSHPDGGIRPSVLDAELAVAGVSYLIIGFDKGRFCHALWRLEGAELTPQPLKVG